ncbi:aquaporin-like protein [Novymonas esmeraldas]|uniref:Aquaporin-like protein n=1 Tax=Novymonas esmeraldas TaxID=1808958 RepID=A0AAW0EXE9_9TRYP
MEGRPVANGARDGWSSGAPVLAETAAGGSSVIRVPGSAAAAGRAGLEAPATPLTTATAPPTRRPAQNISSSVSAILTSPSLAMAGWRGGAAAADGADDPSTPFSRATAPSGTYAREESRYSSERDTARAAPRELDPTEVPALKYTLPVVVTRDGKVVEEELDPFEMGRLYGQQQAALRKLQSRYDFLAVPEWVRLHPLLGTYLAELVGTFGWVLTLALVSVRNRSIFTISDDTNMTPLPIGFMFTSMIFTFGYISGSHFNPAVSIAVFLVRQMELAQCCAFVLCQLAAGLAAGVVAMVIQGNTDIYVPSVSNSYVSSGIFSELIFTFAICLVVLNIAYSRQSGNFFYGFAVGMTMSAGSASVGHISGGAFNPAAATGLQVAMCLAGSCDDLKSIWIYWLAPVAGAVAAAILFSQMAQPTDTQVLEDQKVFQDVNQLHRQRTAQAVSIDAGRDGPDGVGENARSRSASSASSTTSSSARSAARREAREMRELSGTRTREEVEAGEPPAHVQAAAGEGEDWQNRRPPPAPRRSEAVVTTTPETATREAAVANWF